jgi:hypothetical protein
MVKKSNYAAVLVIAIIVCICGLNANAQTVYNLQVPTSNCKLVNISQCFNDTSRDMNFIVGKEVSKLSDLYHFCTDIKVIAEGKPARIILTLDASRSMCEEVTSCTGASKNDPTDKRISGANAFVDSVASRVLRKY